MYVSVHIVSLPLVLPPTPYINVYDSSFCLSFGYSHFQRWLCLGLIIHGENMVPSLIYSVQK